MRRRGDEIISVLPAGWQPKDGIDPCAPKARLPDPAAGLPFRIALVEYGDWTTVKEYRLLGLLETLGRNVPGRPSGEERVARLTALLRTLAFDQIRRLRYGHQQATGFIPGSLVAVPVPPEWWEGANVDFDANTATANGTTLVGLLISPGEEQPEAVAPEAATQSGSGAERGRPPPKRRGRRAHKQPKVEAAMRAHIAPGGKYTLNALLDLSDKALKTEYGVSPYTAKKARNAVSR